MSIKFTSVPAKRLSESITGSSTTFKVNNILGWDGVNLTSASFGSRLWAVFRNSAGTLMEIMEVDPASIISASSPITIILRGLKFDGDQSTSVAGNKLTWVKGDTVVEFGTHVPQLLQSTQIISTPILPTDPANKDYVDTIAILGAADASTTLKGIGRIAQSPNVTLGTFTVTIASPGVFTLNSHGLIAGDSVQFTTTGALPTGISVGTKYYVISTGLTTNTFQVSLTYNGTAVNTSGSQSGTHTLVRTTPIFIGDNDTRILTTAQQQALAGGGDFGTPSSSNKFITEQYLGGGFGDGSDGDVTISAGTTTLTRDMYYNNLVVTGTLDTAGYRIFVKGTISGAGTIRFNGANGTNGGNGSGSTPGSAGTGGAAVSGYFSNIAGGNGAAGKFNGTGNAGSAPSISNAFITTVTNTGGSGGTYDGVSGAASGGIPAAVGVVTKLMNIKFQVIGGLDIASSGSLIKATPSVGGGGGGSGGSGGSANTATGGGGGGGASGGIIAIFARNWTGTFTISATGGNGGNAGAGAGGAQTGGSGGGAGGAGGYVYVVYVSKTWTGSYAISGGSSGTNSSAGASGSAGGAPGAAPSGVSKEIQVNSLF